VSVDPERQREIPHPHPRPGLPDKGHASAIHPQPGVPGRLARAAGAAHGVPTQEPDDEGGSGRRHRAP
jgi:hypothetical protein